MLLTTAVVGVIAAAGSLAGCGTATTPGAGGSGPPAAKATLSIKVSSKGGKVTHWTLRCDPPGGTSPDPAAACKTLFDAKNAFSPQARHMMCPMIMISGRQIIVDGTWFGKKVHRVIIDGSCDVGIFNSLARTFR